MEILQTKTDIGLVRNHNEDYAVVTKHPKNKNIKLLIVADGMGGRNKGEVASKYIATELEKWFHEKSPKILNDTEKAQDLLTKYIKKLNSNLIKKYGEDHLGTTLTLALINKKETLILNVGDSRAYIYKKRKLLQITEDDSDVWAFYEEGFVKKDDLRYFKNNNIISACIGICKELCIVTPTIIDNDYDIIFLVTDGVSDVLTDKKIKKIIRRKKKEKILDEIINEAVNVNQKLKIPFHLKRKYTSNYIIPYHGRDNATCAMYIKQV
ncbi:MAG: serine/threonine-protein phosphatase [Bacilli bacterium]|nr:serine/threonine-protein phosphatase [Bacilli bacterium]